MAKIIEVSDGTYLTILEKKSKMEQEKIKMVSIKDALDNLLGIKNEK